MRGGSSGRSDGSRDYDFSGPADRQHRSDQPGPAEDALAGSQPAAVGLPPGSATAELDQHLSAAADQLSGQVPRPQSGRRALWAEEEPSHGAQGLSRERLAPGAPHTRQHQHQELLSPVSSFGDLVGLPAARAAPGLLSPTSSLGGLPPAREARRPAAQSAAATWSSVGGGGAAGTAAADEGNGRVSDSAAQRQAEGETMKGIAGRFRV